MPTAKQGYADIHIINDVFVCHFKLVLHKIYSFNFQIFGEVKCTMNFLKTPFRYR
jgi:hypothetical protein